jgi:2-polyprenyl-6-methoxyphenol hydroxylase-like FAD-dependent oxidoreductase
VNPRTLELLERSGVTYRMLAMGEPIHGARLWHRGKALAELSFAKLRHKFPFMLALSQATTERLLADALKASGITVERGVRLLSCRNIDGAVEADLKHINGNRLDTTRAPWLVAADGAHSAAREAMKIQFQGSTFSREWHLADVPLETSLAPDLAHVFFLDEGAFLFLLRVIDDKQTPRAGHPLWRVMGNLPNPLERLEQARAAAPAVWGSRFHIAHRVNSSMQVGQVYFAGDAAHVHSPVGARGMNLGIEDVWVLSRLAKRRELDRYRRLRGAVDRRVVNQIKKITVMARGESGIARLIRTTILPRAIKLRALCDLVARGS